MIIEITIPEKVSLNKIYAGMHFRKRKELADLYHEEVLELKGKLKVKNYPVQILYDWHFVKNPLDTLNCAFMSKMIEDGLVAVGVLENDDTKFVRRSILESKKSDKYKNDTVVITISSL
jgi:hypothetical protein